VRSYLFSSTPGYAIGLVGWLNRTKTRKIELKELKDNFSSYVLVSLQKSEDVTREVKSMLKQLTATDYKAVAELLDLVNALLSEAKQLPNPHHLLNLQQQFTMNLPYVIIMNLKSISISVFIGSCNLLIYKELSSAILLSLAIGIVSILRTII